MSNNVMGIIVSFIFIFSIIGLSTVLSELKVLGPEGSRKFIHIGVCNWWLIAMYFFDDPLWASLVPLLFVFINYMSYRFTLFKAMERDNEDKSLGTVYYAISLLILAYVTFSLNISYIGAIGILIMGYGDGFAAIIGKKFGKHKIKINHSNKSVEGSITVFIFSLIISLAFFSVHAPSLFIPASLLIAIIATLLEFFSPLGSDNLTLPLGISLVAYLLIQLV
jgi:phytol kinase